MLVAADRNEPEQTRELFEICIQGVPAEADVTLVVRVDPADESSIRLLEEVADSQGERPLPDIVLIERSDHNDQAVVRACDGVALHGQAAYPLGGIARFEGVETVEAASISEWLALSSA